MRSNERPEMVRCPVIGKLHDIRAISGRHIGDPEDFAAILVLHAEVLPVAIEKPPEMIGAAVVGKLHNIGTVGGRHIGDAKDSEAMPIVVFFCCFLLFFFEKCVFFLMNELSLS